MKKTLFWLLIAVAFAACEKDPNPFEKADIEGRIYLVGGNTNFDYDYSGATIKVAGQSAKTDSEGYFTVKDVIPGSYTLTISKEGYKTEKSLVQHFGGAPSFVNSHLYLLPNLNLNTFEFDSQTGEFTIVVTQNKHITGIMLEGLSLKCYPSTTSDIPFVNDNILGYLFNQDIETVSDDQQMHTFTGVVDAQEVFRTIDYNSPAYLQFLISAGNSPQLDFESEKYDTDGFFLLDQVTLQYN